MFKYIIERDAHMVDVMTHLKIFKEISYEYLNKKLINTCTSFKRNS